MKRVLLVALVVLAWAAAAAAAPSKRDATVFVKEVEAAVKANSKAIAGGPAAVRKHHQWYASLNQRRQAMFVDADACAFASDSAGSLWQTELQYALRPDQLGFQFLERRKEDYRDNMKACKRSLNSFIQDKSTNRR